MISIEAYRSAIGRFYGKAKKSEKPTTPQSAKLASYSFITCLLLLFYGLFIALACTQYFVYFLMLLVAYGYSLTILCISVDILGFRFQKMVQKERMYRKPSLPNGIKAHQALVHCRYLDTFVLDGRDGKPDIQALKIDIRQ